MMLGALSRRVGRLAGQADSSLRTVDEMLDMSGLRVRRSHSTAARSAEGIRRGAAERLTPDEQDRSVNAVVIA
jgi:hypothetical protein